jgi:hypothetical protein
MSEDSSYDPLEPLQQAYLGTLEALEEFNYVVRADSDDDFFQAFIDAVEAYCDRLSDEQLEILHGGGESSADSG